MNRPLAALPIIMSAILALATPAHAQDAAQIAANDSGDTAWMLAASALVLLMTLPGLVLRYGGLVRAGNLLSVALQCGAVACVVSVLWIISGYTLAFGDVTNGWIGNGRAWMLIDLTNVRFDTAIPESTFVLFQMAFAILAPALMIGAWVDRARFSWVVIFCAAWSLIVYAPVAPWVWGGGWLAGGFGTIDFAGGLVVHTTAGVSALVVAILLGRREGFPASVLPPHAPGLTMVGAALLWVGWFGLAGGSAYTATDNASSAILNTHMAASTAALVWLVIERIAHGRPTSMGWATGAIAGLATISPAAAFVSPGAAMLFGALAAVFCYGAAAWIGPKLRIDDSLNVFAVHGVGGIVGTLLLGLFLSDTLGGTGYPLNISPAGQIGAQVLGVVVVAIWSAVGTAILALGISLLAPIRAPKEHEIEGLDAAAHGERAWRVD